MFTATFTDPQGVSHTDAVFALRTATHNQRSETNSHEYFELNHQDFTTIVNEPVNESSFVDNTITCQFYYWVNQAAKDAGAAPYILANMENNSMHFSFTPDETYDGMNLEEKCETYIATVIA